MQVNQNFSRAILALAVLISSSCVSRAKSKRMLHKRSFYKAKIEQAAKLELANKNRRSFEVWMFPHRTDDGYAFQGGWINLAPKKSRYANMQDISKPLSFLQQMD